MEEVNCTPYIVLGQGELRASTIGPTQQAIRDSTSPKSYLEEREGRKERVAGASATARSSTRTKIIEPACS
jgi:hypothetical protein